MKVFILKLLRIFFNFFGFKFLVISKSNKRLLAVKSDLGFWYSGDFFNSSDIAYGVLQQGKVEKDETVLVVKILEKLLVTASGPVYFYDIGANTGYYGILAAFLGKGRITSYFFEPLPEHFNILKESVALNNLNDCAKIFELALGDTSGTFTFYLAGSGSTFNYKFLGLGSFKELKVKSETLDELASKGSLPLPHFMKIDVEGHELKVFKGAKKVIEESHPIVFVEIAHHFSHGNNAFINNDYNATLDFMKQQGYEVFCFYRGRLLHAPSPEPVPAGVAMYLCLHKDKHHFLFAEDKYIFAD